MKYSVIIAGGRDFNDYGLLKTKCDRILGNKSKEYTIEIISGNAKGADDLGAKYAIEKGFALNLCPAEWDNIEAEPCVVKHTKQGKPYNALAGNNRNIEMAKKAQALILFWDGRSPGSSHMLETAKKHGLSIRVVKY